MAEFAKYRGMQTLMSESFYGGFDMERFNFVGFYDRRVDDLCRLSNDLGIEITASQKENKTSFYSEREETERDPQLRKALADIHSDDIRFYESVLEARS